MLEHEQSWSDVLHGATSDNCLSLLELKLDYTQTDRQTDRTKYIISCCPQLVADNEYIHDWKRKSNMFI